MATKSKKTFTLERFRQVIGEVLKCFPKPQTKKKKKKRKKEKSSLDLDIQLSLSAFLWSKSDTAIMSDDLLKTPSSNRPARYT